MAEAINSQALAAFNTLALEAWTESTTTATIVEGDWHTGILQSATDPINFPEPSTLEDGWHVTIFNGATGSVRLSATATGSFRDFTGVLASGMSLKAGDGVKIMNTATVFLPITIDSPSVITAEGDLIVGDSSGEPSRIATATADTMYLGATGGVPKYLEAAFVPTATADTMYMGATGGEAKYFEPTFTHGQKHLWFPAREMIPRTTAGAATGTFESSTIRAMAVSLDFDEATREHVQFDYQMPKSWDGGTVVPQIIWYATATEGDVIWGVQGRLFDDENNFENAFGTAVEITDTASTATQERVLISSEGSAMTFSGTPGSEQWGLFQVYRDATATGDDMASDAKLLGIKIHYTTDAGTDD